MRPTRIKRIRSVRAPDTTPKAQPQTTTPAQRKADAIYTLSRDKKVSEAPELRKKQAYFAEPVEVTPGYPFWGEFSYQEMKDTFLPDDAEIYGTGDF